jgi:hypothetical protein
MANDIEISLRRFMITAREAGVEIELKGDRLLVRGSPDRTDIYDEIRRRKLEIVEAMSNLPDAVNSYYVPRLQKGIDMLMDCLDRLTINPDDKKLKLFLIEKMCLWVSVDEELRRIYPEFRGCPIGGCDTSGIPVRCLHCATSTPLKAWPQR